jgi:hypothetical protein
MINTSCPPAARRLDRVEHQPRGVRARRPRHDLRAGALGPDSELLDGGGAKRVAGRQQHPLAFGVQLLRQLADGGGLARAVDPDHQDHEGLCLAHHQRPRHRAEHFFHLGGQNLAHLGGADVALIALGAQRVGDGGRRLQPQIGADQYVFELVQRRRVELFAREQPADGRGELVGGALQTPGEPGEPVLARRRCGGIDVGLRRQRVALLLLDLLDVFGRGFRRAGRQVFVRFRDGGRRWRRGGIALRLGPEALGQRVGGRCRLKRLRGRRIGRHRGRPAEQALEESGLFLAHAGLSTSS